MSTRPILLLLLAACGSDEDDVFDTGPAGDGPALTQARVLVEHNATDADSGFQLFVDGEPWDRLVVTGPGGVILDVTTDGALVGFGLTEGFFESNEPAEEDMSREDVLRLLPEGDYTFEAAASADGATMRGEATLSHDLPAEPVIVAPAEDAVVDPAAAVIDWDPVTTTVDGGPIAIVGYQVIVVKDVETGPTPSFFRNELSVFLPPDTTRLAVPTGFLEAGAPYEVEVLALAASGNQTIGLRAFETADAD